MTTSTRREAPFRAPPIFEIVEAYAGVPALAHVRRAASPPGVMRLCERLHFLQ